MYEGRGWVSPLCVVVSIMHDVKGEMGEFIPLAWLSAYR